MSTKRIKAESFTTYTAFEVAANRVAFAQTELSALELRRDAIIQRVQARFDAKITELQEEIAYKMALCEKYAEDHRPELLPDETKSKSAETALTCYGFALANKKAVKPTSKKVDEETIIAAMKARNLSTYVRTVEEIAKDKIITDATFDETLRSYVLVSSSGEKISLDLINLKLVQGETFFIRPKVESAETVKP